jgi:hypothetical protein
MSPRGEEYMLNAIARLAENTKGKTRSNLFESLRRCNLFERKGCKFAIAGVRSPGAAGLPDSDRLLVSNNL